MSKEELKALLIETLKESASLEVNSYTIAGAYDEVPDRTVVFVTLFIDGEEVLSGSNY